MGHARQQRTSERREERADRILDTTKELILRWGYRKTTLDDIARHADVGKGTLFLHWPNRDALFVSLLRRERVRMLMDLTEAVSEASEAVTVGGFFRHYVQAYTRRPLLKALLLGDQSTLGRLADRKRAGGSSTSIRGEFGAYLEALRDRGLVRDDLPTGDLLFTLTATIYGFVALPFLGSADLAPAEDDFAPLSADTIARVLAPASPPAIDRTSEVRDLTLEHLDRMLTVARARYEESLSISQK